MVRVLLVGGTFDSEGGKRSKIIRMIGNAISEMDDIIVMIENGGSFSDIPNIVDLAKYADIVCWFPNIPNTMEKIRNLKAIYPDKILITSKRNTEGSYNFQNLINHALGLKSNLLLEFTTEADKIRGRVIDPLGVVWVDYTEDFDALTNVMLQRAITLSQFTRISSSQVGPAIVIPDRPDFFNIIRDYAEVFHDLINPEEGVTRFLGNASFRCERGFPSFRGGEYIFVSRRNVDKRYIDQEGFVATKMAMNGSVEYYGDNKPSVDTPIQQRLYAHYPNINYMIHAHVYIKNAPFTSEAIPCGAVEEASKVMGLITDSTSSYFAVNLLGHGSIIASRDLGSLLDINYISRPVGEILE